MLDHLPCDLLAAVISRVGEHPHAVLSVCKATQRAGQDTGTLLLWLQHTFSPNGAIFMFTSLRRVHRWAEPQVLQAMQQLIHFGCSLKDPTQTGCVLYWAVKRHFAQVLSLLLSHLTAQQSTADSNGAGNNLSTWLHSLLKTAAAQGHQGCVRVLLSNGADPNVDGGRPLKAATEAGCVGCVSALLDAGADLHAGADTALRLCAAAGSPAHIMVMRLLLERGADVHAKADEALSLAVERSNADAVALLLRHGANASARQVLESAAATGCASVVRLLLAHGAAPDADGGRPLRAAAEAGAVEVVHQLLDAGAKCGAPPPHRRSLGMRPGHGSRYGSPAGTSGQHIPKPATQLSRNSMDAAMSLQKHNLGSGNAVTHQFRSCSSSWQASASHLQGGAHNQDQQPNGDTATSSGSRHSHNQLQETSSESVDVQQQGCHVSDGSSGFNSCEEAMGWEEGEEGLWEDELEDEGSPLGSPTAGSEALCAALCAGESLAASVLLERGACVDVNVLNCWRQWHCYPGIVALLQSHHLQPALQHHLSGTGQIARQAGGHANLHMHAPCSLGIQQHLRDSLTAAATEGAETAVRLFLTWGAPNVNSNASAGIALSGMQSCQAGFGAIDNILGVLTPACLGAAMTAAARLNRPVIAKQLLHHCEAGQWQQAVLHPSALHAAVTEGHIDMVKLLLQAGAAQLVPHHAAPSPKQLSSATPTTHTPQPGFSQALDTTGHQDHSYSPPPPPYQSEAWGTVILCSAAACKAGCKAALAITEMLLQHGLGLSAQQALRLVAVGRAPTWRDEAAKAILAVAFGNGLT